MLQKCEARKYRILEYPVRVGLIVDEVAEAPRLRLQQSSSSRCRARRWTSRSIHADHGADPRVPDDARTSGLLPSRNTLPVQGAVQLDADTLEERSRIRRLEASPDCGGGSVGHGWASHSKISRRDVGRRRLSRVAPSPDRESESESGVPGCVEPAGGLPMVVIRSADRRFRRLVS